MLKISHISKTFNPGTVNEKKAIPIVTMYCPAFPGSPSPKAMLASTLPS